MYLYMINCTIILVILFNNQKPLEKKISYSYNYNIEREYTIKIIYITLTSKTLLPSEIILVCLRLINITNNLALTLARSVLNSSNN